MNDENSVLLTPHRETFYNTEIMVHTSPIRKHSPSDRLRLYRYPSCVQQNSGRLYATNSMTALISGSIDWKPSFPSPRRP